MLNTSLLKILSAFGDNDIRKFHDFIVSPYHNKKKGAVLLYEYIIKFRPELKDPKLERKKAWDHMNPGKAFNYGIMKNLIYDLTRLSEEFIISERVNSNYFFKVNELLTFFSERDMKGLFSSEFNNFEKTALKFSFKNDMVREDYFYYMWKLFVNKWGFENQLMHSKNYEGIIDKSSDNFIATFFIHAFIIYHNIEAQKLEHNYSKNDGSVVTFLKNAHRADLISRTISSINPVSADVSAVLNVYHKMFVSVEENNDSEKYFDFKKTLGNNKSYFSKRDLLALHITLLNCLTYLDSKSVFKQEESLDIYDSMIKSKIFFADNSVVWEQDFLSYITAACNLGKRTAIEKFINDVINKTTSDNKENMMSFAKAHLYFLKGEFGKALEYISLTSYDLFQMKYYLKNLQIRIFYELNDLDSYLHALDSYKHFLDNNKNVSERWRSSMKSFCSNVSKLFKLKNKFSEYEYVKFRNEIKTRNGDHKTWLQRKIEELEVSGQMRVAKSL